MASITAPAEQLLLKNYEHDKTWYVRPEDSEGGENEKSVERKITLNLADLWKITESWMIKHSFHLSTLKERNKICLGEISFSVGGVRIESENGNRAERKISLNLADLWKITESWMIKHSFSLSHLEKRKNICSGIISFSVEGVRTESEKVSIEDKRIKITMPKTLLIKIIQTCKDGQDIDNRITELLQKGLEATGKL